MNVSLGHLVVFIVGLGLVFYGLPLFRGAITIFGFVIGAFYGLVLFLVFTQETTFDPVLKVILAILAAIVGGFLGSALASFAEAIFVFLAGGLVGLMIAKVVAGVPVEQAQRALDLEYLRAMMHPQLLDIVWFVIGGAIFVFAMDIVIVIALCILGASLIYRGLLPLNLLKPSWLIPAILGVLGFLSQEGYFGYFFRGRRRIVVVETPSLD